MNLYDIDEAILSCIDTENGDIIDIDRLEALEVERDRKISNIACWVKDLKAEAEAIKAEKQNLDKRQKAAENKAGQLTEYLNRYLNGAKYKDSRCAISYRASTATELDESFNLDKLPKKYKIIKATPSLSAIKEALLNGVKIKGARIVEKQNIQIR